MNSRFLKDSEKVREEKGPVFLKNPRNSLKFPLTRETDTKKPSNLAKLQFVNDEIYSYKKKPFGTWKFGKIGFFGQFYHSRIAEFFQINWT
jgi:hypothetical protein